MTHIDTDTLVKLAGEVTQGKWKLEAGSKSCHCCFEFTVYVSTGPGEFEYDLVCETLSDEPDARAIALVPDLLDETIALRAQAAKDKARLERLEAALAALILNIDAGGATLGAMKDARAALEDGE